MSLHTTLMSTAGDVLVAVQGETKRVRLRAGARRSWSEVTALIGGIELIEEEREEGSVIDTRSIERCTVGVATDELDANVPTDDWQVELDGQVWPVERVTGRGTIRVTFHLQRTLMKRHPETRMRR